jgi:hypothetical protein
MANFQIKDFTSGLAVKIRMFFVNTDEAVAVHSLVDTANGEILGTKTDAAATQTDTTSLSFMAVFKQISKSLQAPPSQGYTSVVSVTRTADTNAYAANDAIGSSVSAGGAVLTFSNIGPAGGGEVQITSVAFEIDDTALISGESSYRLYLYNASPGSNLADNAAWDIVSGDRASFLGYIDLGFPVDLGSTLYVQSDLINRQITIPSGGALKAYLTTTGAYTPSSARVYKTTLHAMGV